MEYNVLCLHGCCQNKEMFTNLLNNFIKLCKRDKINFYFIQGKYNHPERGYTWYNEPLEIEKIGNTDFDEHLVCDCLDDVELFIKENNINVLFGFSQGGNVVDTFLQHRPHQQIKKAIILSSYSLNESVKKIIDDVEVLNITSECDTIVKHTLFPKNYSKLLHITHNKGHKIPGSSTMRQIRKFILKGNV